MKKFILLFFFFFLIFSYYGHHYLQRQFLIADINQLTTQREHKNSSDIPPVAVVMTTYNRADLLPRAIDSILNQTYTNFDFIIVDDGSTDLSLQLLYDYMKKDKRIRIYPNNSNKGIAYSRNKLLKLVQNKYFAIMDSDDWSYPQRLEKQFSFMEKNPDITIVSGQAFFLHNNKRITHFVQDTLSFVSRFVIDCPIANDSIFVRNDFIQKNNITYPAHVIASEDYWFFADIIEKKGRFYVLEEPVIKVRAHNTNPKKYYEDHKKIIPIVQQKICNIFYDCKKTAYEEPLCDRLKKINIVNKEKQYFTQEQMNYAIKQRCPADEDEILGCFIFQDDIWGWADYIINDSKHNIVYRHLSSEKIDIIEQTPEKIVLNLATHKNVIFVPHDKSDCWISVKP